MRAVERVEERAVGKGLWGTGCGERGVGNGLWGTGCGSVLVVLGEELVGEDARARDDARAAERLLLFLGEGALGEKPAVGGERELDLLESGRQRLSKVREGEARAEEGDGRRPTKVVEGERSKGRGGPWTERERERGELHTCSTMRSWLRLRRRITSR